MLMQPAPPSPFGDGPRGTPSAGSQDVPERVAIAGAGVAGAFLYRALASAGRDVEIYELPDRGTTCGLHPCAWGTGPEFFRMMADAGADSTALVTNHVPWVDFEGRRFRAEVSLLSKPHLIRDLLGGATVRMGPIPADSFDRILDCTGAARAYLPPTDRPDLLGETVQMRMRIPDLREDTILIRFARDGYCWAFPLGGRRFHVGAGAFVHPGGDLLGMLRSSGLLDDDGRVAGCDAERLCGCDSAIRMTGPLRALPHMVPGSQASCPVWGVGEAIGTVSPVTGEGIAHAVRCAGLYLEHETDPRAYSDAVLREFAWMSAERTIVDKVGTGGWISRAEWHVLQRNAASMGIRMGLSDVVVVLANLARRGRIPISILVPSGRGRR
jgi:hypothetical protein